MNIESFWNNLRELYPDSLRCEWDNDGLMCCADRGAQVKRVLCALDATADVLHYAAQNGFDTVLALHPMIFRPLRSVAEGDFCSDRVIYAVKNGLSVISMHTRMDAGAGGVNDALAEALGLSDVRVFGTEDEPELGRMGESDIHDAKDFAEHIKKSLGAPSVTAYICSPVRKVAVVGGRGDDFISAAKARGADTLVTGEAGYNDGIDAAEAGINVFCAGHYYTEFPVCRQLARLASQIAGAETEIYTKIMEQYF